ncbi:glycoside hydrolase domain-containing protein [Marinifilum breve]
MYFQTNVYVDRVELNGKVLSNFTLKHTVIMNGGEIIFYMSKTAKK